MPDFGTVTADPVVLTNTAEDAMRRINEYRSAMQEIANQISSTANTWKGEAGDAFREVFREEYSKAESALEVYEQYPKDLLEFAGLYEKVIGVTEGTASSVSTFTMH